MSSDCRNKLFGFLMLNLFMAWVFIAVTVLGTGLKEAGQEIGAQGERAVQRSFEIQKAWQAEQLQRLRSHTNLRADAEESDG